jgi:GT2 family glycosyltransferase
MLSISVVSHRQGAMVRQLLDDIARCCRREMEVILTFNIQEEFALSSRWDFPIRTLTNRRRKGFAANHNAAFEVATGSHYCVVNPDIRLVSDPFGPLLESVADSQTGVVGPVVVNSQGERENSARCLPTPWTIAKKALGWPPRPDYLIGDEPIFPHWIGGMFMLFRSEVFSKLKGFDERYHLYYEDVDICCRVWLSDKNVMLNPRAEVIHEAQFQSHRSLRYFRWHLASMMRFFCSPVFMRCEWRRWTKELGQGCDRSSPRGIR